MRERRPVARREHEPDRGSLAVGELALPMLAQDGRGQFFSEERLAELIRADGANSTSAVVDRILAAVESFESGAERADDITVLALQVLAAADREAVIAETVMLRNQLSDLDTLDDLLDRFGKEGRLPPATGTEAYRWGARAPIFSSLQAARCGNSA